MLAPQSRLASLCFARPTIRSADQKKCEHVAHSVNNVSVHRVRGYRQGGNETRDGRHIIQLKNIFVFVTHRHRLRRRAYYTRRIIIIIIIVVFSLANNLTERLGTLNVLDVLTRR